MLLCLAGAVRNAAGFVWAYNTNLFFENVRGLTQTEIAYYMSWIPLVSGSLGATVGGFIADNVIKNRGSAARVWVLILSQLGAAPFAAMSLLIPVPWAFITQIPTSVIGEMWVGVTLALVVELVPAGMRVTAVSVYFFIISNIAGLGPLLVPPFQTLFNDSLKTSLLLLYPGLYVASAAMFFLTFTVLKKDLARAKEEAHPEATSLLSGQAPSVVVPADNETNKMSSFATNSDDA